MVSVVIFPKLLHFLFFFSFVLLLKRKEVSSSEIPPERWSAKVHVIKDPSLTGTDNSRWKPVPFPVAASAKDLAGKAQTYRRNDTCPNCDQIFTEWSSGRARLLCCNCYVLPHQCSLQYLLFHEPSKQRALGSLLTCFLPIPCSAYSSSYRLLALPGCSLACWRRPVSPIAAVEAFFFSLLSSAKII